MPKAITNMYKKAGVPAPKHKSGKGKMTKAWHECRVRYMKKGMSGEEAAKRCTGGLGKENSFKK